MDDDVKAAIERLRESAGWSNSPEDVELLCNALERIHEQYAAARAAHSRCVDRVVRELRHAVGPRYLIRDGHALEGVHTAGLLELLLTQTQATLDDLRVITALGIGGCHDVKTDSDAWVRIERIEP